MITKFKITVSDHHHGGGSIVVREAWFHVARFPDLVAAMLWFMGDYPMAEVNW